MAKHIPQFTIFPHNKRIEQVQKDGRIYFRSHIPNFCSGIDPIHYFFDTMDDFCQFLNKEYGKWTLKFELGVYTSTEWLVVAYKRSGEHWVLGYCSNIKNVIADNKSINSAIPIFVETNEENNGEG